MFTYLLKRLALTVPTFIALMFITFVMVRLVPGDPIEVRRGERGIDPERLEFCRPDLDATVDERREVHATTLGDLVTQSPINDD